MARAAAKAASSTWGIRAQVRKALRDRVLALRKALEDDFRRQLVALGVHPDRTDPVPGGRTLSPGDERARQAVVAVIERAAAAKTPREEAFGAFVRDSAFTFLNRCFGLRCLEERGLLLVDGQPETAIRKDERINASSLSFRVRNEFPTEASPREVWQETLRRAWQAISEHVRVVFDPDSEYGQLFPLQPTLTKVIDALNASEIAAETYAEDEVWGWVYQYYNTEEKDAVYEKLGKGGKVERPDELAAATCLYTERYMVDFLLQNTLGALWAEMHPETKLLGEWIYYVRPPEGEAERKDRQLPEQLRDLTLLDPACGSGHFLARAFDLLAEMYEEEGIEAANDIPHLIIERNLHGIDIDLRAVQISALRLYLKACGLAGSDFRPRQVNLVSADVTLPDRTPTPLLVRFSSDRDVQQLIEAIWSEFKDAPQLGSLLHPERRIDEALARRRRKGDTLERQDERAWERFKFELLDGIREEFEKEAHSEDIGRRLFGQDLAKGISLLEALSRHYDVVVTNPPYAGSTNLDEPVKRFIEREYKDGKRDLYAAFILRDLEFARPGGLIGMVTQQSWLFQRDFARLRQTVLSRSTLDCLLHLGPRAFEEISGEVVKVVCFVLRVETPTIQDRFVAARLTGPETAQAKKETLVSALAGRAAGILFGSEQLALLAIPDAPIAYWLRPRLLELLQKARPISSLAAVKEGLGTRDDERFLRWFWEPARVGVVENEKPKSGRWFWCAKGGRYQKWAGLYSYVVEWVDDGATIKAHIVRRYPYLKGKTGWLVKDTEFYFKPGVTYSLMGRDALGARVIARSIFNDVSPTLFSASEDSMEAVAAILNTRVATYLLRAMTQDVKFKPAYVAKIPVPELEDVPFSGLARACVVLKGAIVSRFPTEGVFKSVDEAWLESIGDAATSIFRSHADEALLHALEGLNERLACDAYRLDEADVQVITDETGIPAGWYPMIVNYDEPPQAPDQLELPHELFPFLETLERRDLSSEQLEQLKGRLRTLYRAGPGAKVEDTAETGGDEEDEAILGAYIPIPTETFLEELAVKLRIHPITVYRLLEEMREQERLVSPPELRRTLENYVSVTILRLLGYRWPQQGMYEAEHGPIIDPDLVDPDGITPLVRCTDDPAAAERVRMRMERQFGEEGAARSLQEFRTWVGKDLDDWVKREFFRRHIQQFKRRPITWHLTSPDGTFQAFVLYHKLSRETLERLRTKYAGGLINRLRAEHERAQERKDTNRARELALQIEDVEEFRSRVQAIIEGRELRYRIRCRWKGEEKEGRPGSYAPDLDDGVKVNIRPFQEAGLLEREVIKKW